MSIVKQQTLLACSAEFENMKSKINLLCIKCLDHILSCPDTLAFKIFRVTNSNNKWIKQVSKILNDLGFSYIKLIHTSFKPTIPFIKQRILDQSI